MFSELELFQVSRKNLSKESLESSKRNLFSRLQSGSRAKMSLVAEYRRLAAASLDLAKRSAAGSGKMRLLVIAGAWLELAERVRQKSADAKRAGAPAEYRKSDKAPLPGSKRLRAIPK